MPRRTLATTALMVVALLGPAGVASAAGPPLSHARILAHFDVTAGQQPENLLVEPAGVDLVFARSFQVVRIDNHHRSQVLTTLPTPADGGVHTPRIGFAIATGIARGMDGSYYVAYAAGSDDLTGVWRFRPGQPPARVVPLSSVQLIAEGDLGSVHYHYQADTADRGKAVEEVFRVRDGRIVEHWDAHQDVPATAANPNTMF